MKAIILFILGALLSGCAAVSDYATGYEQAYRESQRNWDSFNIQQTRLDQQTAAFNQAYGFK